MSVRSNIINVVTGLLVVLVLMSMAGCGGGGSGGVAAPAPPPAPAPTRATLKFSINNLVAPTKAGALQVHFNLPAGVVPLPLSGSDASGSIVFSGASSLSLASFVSPVVTIGVASIAGLPNGEYATMTCAISPGATVTSGSFPAQATIDIADDIGTPSLPIAGLTVPIAVTLN